MKKIYTLLFTGILFAGTASKSAAQEKINREESSVEGNSESEESEGPEFGNKRTDHASTSWYLEMFSARPNVLEAEKKFNAYFATHPDERSVEKNQFRRWLENARLSLDENGYYIPYEGYASSATARQTVAGNPNTGTWSAIGPNHAALTQCGTSSFMSGGFCDRVYINPYNTQNLFAGSSYGGLWVSQNQGSTWSLTDPEFDNGTNTYANRDYYYGEVEASKVDPTLIFAATESGLLKSTNSGTSWTMCPQLNRTVSSTLRPYYVALSTSNASVVMATFGRKLFRSTDGGTTWALAFDNSNGGANVNGTGVHNVSSFGLYERNYNFFGLEDDYNDPNAFYLGAWNASNQACIYKSTDAGVSFSLLVNLNTALKRNLPKNLIFQTILSQPDRFYVYPQYIDKDSLYRFNDNGTLLSRIKLNSEAEAGDIDWLDENNMYCGFYFASSIMKSTNGGVAFADQTSGYSGCPKYVHPDVRAIDVVGNLVLIGSDGGLAMSTDAMKTVKTTGWEISSTDLWGFSSSPRTDVLSVGCDHGPSKIRRYDANQGWISVGGGDAGVTSVNQSNDRLIYYNWGYGTSKCELDANNNITNKTTISVPVTLDRLECHPNLYKVVYGTTGTQVQVSRDNVTTFKLFYDFGQTVNVFKIAQQDTNSMYVLLGNKTIKKTINGGGAWTTITPSATASGNQTNIVDITLGDSPNEIWAAYGNSQKTAKVLKSTDGGASWINITTSNLPATPVYQITYQHGSQGGVYIAFAGNSGVWYRNNALAQWAQLGNGLPMLGFIKNIHTVPGKGKFRMGSSRGVWENDLYENTPPKANMAVDKNFTPCGPSYKVQFVDASALRQGTSTKYAWSFPGGVPSTSTIERPQVYYPLAGKYSVTLTVTDQFGTSTQTLTNFMTVTGNCTIGIEEVDLGVASDLSLMPNPSATTVNVLFTLSKTSNAELALYDILGKEVKVIMSNQQLNAGDHTYAVDISSLEKGIYLCKLNVEGVVKSKLLVKE